MTTVLVPYLEEGQELMRQIENVTVYTSMAERKELLEKAKKYSLNINRYKFRQIYDAGGITFKEDMGVYLLNYAFMMKKKWEFYWKQILINILCRKNYLF